MNYRIVINVSLFTLYFLNVESFCGEPLFDPEIEQLSEVNSANDEQEDIEKVCLDANQVVKDRDVVNHELQETIWKTEENASEITLTVLLKSIDIDKVVITRNEVLKFITIVIPQPRSTITLEISSHGQLTVTKKSECEEKDNHKAFYECYMAQTVDYLSSMIDIDKSGAAVYCDGVLTLTLVKKNEITTINIVKK